MAIKGINRGWFRDIDWVMVIPVSLLVTLFLAMIVAIAYIVIEEEKKTTRIQTFITNNGDTIIIKTKK